MKGLNVGLFLLVIASLVLQVTAIQSNENPNLPPLSCLDKINNDPAGGDPAIDCADRQNGGLGALTCTAEQFHPDPCPNGERVICIPGEDDYDGIYKAGWICPKGGYHPIIEYRTPTLTPTPVQNYPEGEYGMEEEEYYEEVYYFESYEIEYYENDYYSDEHYYDNQYDDYYSDYYYDEYGYEGYGSAVEPNWYADPEPAYAICGDGICSYGEYCISDCGYAYDYGYGYPYYDYGYGYNDPYGYYGYYDYGYGYPYYDYGYGYNDFCYVNAPRYAYTGEWTPIQVVYYGAAPYSVQVDCGDGSVATAYRNGIYSYDGILYAQCHYTYEGTFFPNAYAGGIICAGDAVTVRGTGGTYQPYEPDFPYEPYYPSPSPSPYPSPSPVVSPSPRPRNPSCALTAFPAAVQEGESAIVSVNYYDLSGSPNAISVNCGNGETKNAVDCFGRTGSCSVFCNYQENGAYHASASTSGIACSPITINVNEKTSEKCSDGTLYGTCSVSKPKYCEDGFLINRATVCGCPEGQVESGNKCVTPSGSCSVTLNPSIVRANSQTNVMINYDGIDLNGGTAQVVCGNGNTVTASCTETDALSGTCTASCFYEEESAYPRAYTVNSYVKGKQCSSANLQVTAPLENTGNLLAKVSACSSGEALEHARVRIQNQPDYFTDSNGQLNVQLEPATYTVEVFKTDYLPESTTVQVQKGKVATASVCLNEEGCDISAVLIRTPEVDDSRDVLLFQIKITNNLNSENQVAIDYSSALKIVGPAYLTLQPNEAKTISVYVYSHERLVGRSYGSVSISGLGDCAKNIDLPINVVGGLSLEVSQLYKETFPDEKVCFDLLVRNRGTNEGTVTLRSEGDLEGDFNVGQFFLTSREIRDDLQFCAVVPSGESGSHTILLEALSPISDDGELVTVDVLDSGEFDTDFGDGCIYVRETAELFPITIDNDVADGDYAVTLRDNEVNARVVPSMLYNFKKGTSRTVYISADPNNFDYGDEIVQLVLRKDSAVAMQEEICLISYEKSVYRREVFSQLSESVLNLHGGGSVSTVLAIKNVGTRSDYYFIRVESPLTVSLSESSFYLQPEEEKRITVRFSASSGTVAKRYSIPIKIYSGRGSGGVYYNEGYYNNYNDEYDGVGNAFIKCGNGKTVSLNCYEGSGKCSASCEYDDYGTYTIDANVGNQQCDENRIRVIRDDDSGCVVTTESFVREGDTAEVTVGYQDLPYEPLNEEITIFCGNGETVVAEDCDGKTGSCSERCHYDGEGSFTVGASAGGLACTSGFVEVGDENEYCSISSKGLIEEGDRTTIELEYRNVYYGGQYFPYNYRDYDDYYNDNYHYSGSGVLLKTENVVVIVDGGGATGTIKPGDLYPDAIEVKRVIAADLPSTGKANVAITFENKRDYKLDDILLQIEELPQGVTLVQVAPFELEANKERTVYFRLEAAGAEEGVHPVKLALRFDNVRMEREFEIRIVPESEILKAEIEISEVEYSQSGQNAIARVDFAVRNLESSAMRISALFKDMPENWSAQVEPSLAVIPPGKAMNFSANVTAVEFGAKSYSASIELRSVDGRRYSTPIVFEFQKLNPFSGLFAFFTAIGPLQILLILAIIVIGVLAYNSSRKGDEAVSAAAEAEAEESDAQTHLKTIEDEISKEAAEQTTLLDENKFKKKKAEGNEPEGEDGVYFDVPEEE